MKATATGTRLHCYSLISSIETDIRRAISERMTLSEVDAKLAIQLKRKTQPRIQRSGLNQGTKSSSFETLLDYSDLGDLGQILTLHRSNLNGDTQQITELAESISRVIATRNRVFHSRPLEPDDYAKTADLVESALNNRHFDWRETQQTIKLLETSPADILRLRIPAFWREEITIFHNLPTPDFDETGYIGKKDERRKLLRHLLGPHPVVSLIGEGGIGKSALALRCLYDLIESDDAESFDAVIWVSLKTRVLTASGIKEITNTVTDATGILSAIDAELGGDTPNTSDPFSTLSEYLTEMPVLLALDNLETFSDHRLTDFLEQIPRGSKILITSRVAPEVGVSLPISAMNENEAVQLFFQFSRVLGLNEVSDIGARKAKTFCQKLHFSPLAIKWFIKSMASGEQPARLLARKGGNFQEVLKFCFENVLDALDKDSRELLSAIFILKRQVTSTELALLLELDPLHVESMLKRLYQSSLINRTIKSNHAPSDYHPDIVFYQASTFVQKYINSFMQVDSSLATNLQSKDRQLRASVEKTQVARAHSRWDIENIRARTHDERLMLPKLLRGITLSRKKRHNEALSLLDEAIDALPSFAEAYRIKAKIAQDAERPFDAEENFLAALDVDPEDELSKYHYGIFLSRTKEDFASALDIFSALVETNPDDPFIEGNLARTEMILGSYESAEGRFDRILLLDDNGSPRLRLLTYFQAIENVRRKLEWSISKNDSASFLKDSEKLLLVLSNIVEENNIDRPLIQRARDCMEELARGLNKFKLTYFSDKLLEWGERCSQPLQCDLASIRGMQSYFLDICKQPALLPKHQETGEYESGVIRTILHKSGYGFIRSSDSNDLFFHKDNSISDFYRLNEGQSVTFNMGSNSKGPCAINVRACES